MATMRVKAKEVKTGDFLPGLDNGYVFTDPETNDAGYFTAPGSARYSSGMPEDTVLITYHDTEGEECYLLLPAESGVQVER